MKTACIAFTLSLSNPLVQAKNENPVKQEVNIGKQFTHPDRIRYDGSCMTIDGKDIFVYSAAFHYFRCPEE